MKPGEKNSQLNILERVFGRLGLWMFGHRVIVFTLVSLLLAAALYLAAGIRTDNSFDAFFSESDAIHNAYMSYQDDFGSDEIAYIVYRVPGSADGPFDLAAMRKIAKLSQALEEEVPFVREVTSLTNVEFMQAVDDFLEITELEQEMPASQDELTAHGAAMMKKPIYRDALISRDGGHGAIILEMTATSSDPLESIRLDPAKGDSIDNLYPQASHNRIVEILARPEYRGIEFWWSGDVPLNAAYNETIGNESGLLALLSMVLVAIIAAICFRGQLLGLVGPLSVVIVALVLTVGFMGLAGYKLGILFLIAPTLLTAIGVAQSIHLISEFNRQRAAGALRRDAIQQTLERVALPCLLAAVTTAIGFLVMSGSKLRALAEMAIYLGIGVMLTFVASITVMICIMSLGKNESVQAATITSKRADKLQRMLTALVTCNLRYRHVILGVSTFILAIALAGASKLQISFNFLEDFKQSTQFRQHAEYVQDTMGGILNMVFIYEAEQPEAVKTAAILAHLEALQQRAEQSPLVTKSYSIVDILKDINQSFHGDDPAFHKLPEDDELIAQYLLLYEISGGGELEDYVSGDYQRTTLELRINLVDSVVVGGLVTELEEYLAANPAPGATVEITGIGMLWMTMGEYIAASQIQGYLLAFIFIAAIMCLAFRSLKVGLLAMIPNLFPIVLILGAMGALGMHLDYLRMLLATVAIGIAVDDTVHMTSRIRKEFLRCGNYEEAIRNGLLSVGRPVIITSVILSLSFLIYFVSEMAILTSFGMLLSITVVTALLADLFLLPALLLVLRPFGKEWERSELTAEAVSPAARIP